MSRFNERLALMADAARTLPDGEEIAHGLMRLAEDVDDYLAQQLDERNAKLNTAFGAWNDFMSGALANAAAEGERKIVLERHRIARLVASDSRWIGGYADALNLLERE